MGSTTRKSIRKSAFSISACTGLSRVLGLVREVLMARFFGTTLIKSAFDLAFTVPNLFRQLFGEGALSAAFIPVFTETREKEGDDSANRLAGKVITMLASLMILIVGVGILGITWFIHRDGLGLKAEATLPLLRIMLPYAFFICIAALLSSVLNSRGRFVAPALTSVLLNVLWICVLIFACPCFGDTEAEKIKVVAWGVIAAGLIQLLYQIPVLLLCGIKPVLSFNWKDKRVARMIMLMGPVALGMGVHQVNVCLDRILAMWASDWATAALVYSERIIYLPLGVFATAFGTVLLPAYSMHVTRDEAHHMPSTFASACKDLMFFMVPAAVGIAILAADIVGVVFESGKFDSESTFLTARAVRFYAPGLVVFGLYKLMVPAFYALKDTRTPLKVGMYTVALNLILNVVFVITWPLEYKHAGLATATVLSCAFNFAVLSWIMTARLGTPGWKKLMSFFLKVSAAAAAMGVVIRFLRNFSYDFVMSIDMPHKLLTSLFLALLVLAGIVVYGGISLFAFRDESRRFLKKIRRK